MNHSTAVTDDIGSHQYKEQFFLIFSTLSLSLSSFPGKAFIFNCTHECIQQTFPLLILSHFNCIHVHRNGTVNRVSLVASTAYRALSLSRAIEDKSKSVNANISSCKVLFNCYSCNGGDYDEHVHSPPHTAGERE